ncbi:TPA: hypothetical protein ACG59B_000987 [Streptococcus agalactiae]|nr:hypothetical protein [Streptococcus agalactiae]
MDIFSEEFKNELRFIVKDTVSDIVTKAIKNGSFNSTFTIDVANDAFLSQKFCMSKSSVGTIRREMRDFPSYTKFLRNGGSLVTVKGFDEYLQYRGSWEWKKEKAKLRTKKRTH